MTVVGQLYVCSDCGTTLTHDDGFIDACCKECGGLKPVSMAVYESEAARRGEVRAFIQKRNDRSELLLRDAAGCGWVASPDTMEVTR